MEPQMLWTLFTIFFIASPSLGQTPTMGKADAGVSDTYLASLGTAAPSYLIARLRDPVNEKYYRGIVSRLKWGTMDEQRENQDIFKGLTDFIAINSSRAGEIPVATWLAMGDALEIIGQRGAGAGVGYLTEWVTTANYVKTIHCHTRTYDSKALAEELQRSAIVGLGFSGDQSASEVLHQLSANPPKVHYPGSLRGVLNRAIAENAKIQKDGPEIFFRVKKQPNK